MAEIKNTSQKVVEVARKLFIEKGFEAVSMAMIAEAAGIKKPSLYYFFASKEEMFRLIISETMGELIPEICRRLQFAMSHSPDDLAYARKEFVGIVEWLVERTNCHRMVVRDSDLARLHFSDTKAFCGAEAGLLEMKKSFTDFFRHFGVDKPELAFEIADGAAHAFLIRHKKGLTKTQPREFAEHLAEIIIH